MKLWLNQMLELWTISVFLIGEERVEGHARFFKFLPSRRLAQSL